jgi:cytochrome c oxidase cbb3-type subunit 4
MDANDLRALATVAAFACFIGIFLWAYHRKSRKAFDEAAQLPFADDAADAATHRVMQTEAKR